MGRTDTGSPARKPDAEGYVTRDGVSVFWEAFGSGESTILLLPTWSIIHSRHWKAQIPYLARHFRVVTFDARGNGLSDRPAEEWAYADAELVEDAVAVLDRLGVESALAAGLSCGGRYALQLAAAHPERVRGVFAIAPSIPFLCPRQPWRAEHRFDDVLDTDEGWAKDNRHYWLRDYKGYVEFFFSEVFTEPHSTKQIEDCVAWGLDTDPETLLLTECKYGFDDREGAERLCRSIRCPVLVVHGTEDRIGPLERSERVAELTGGRLVRIEGGGHAPQARDPVLINLLLRDFAAAQLGEPPGPRAWTRGRLRPKRALFVSSPIGLGHAWRDVAIADELRRQVPGLEIHWLAQHPVTTVLERRDEAIHRASAELASESEHIDAEAGEHELHAFEALRRMDDIFCANFMLFHDVVEEDRYDLWIGDEAWELDYFLHENPELKTSAYAWLTDFVGYLPLPEGGAREALLTADYNAEMIEQVERYPRVRDRSIFIGDPGDVVPGAFGPGLPLIRDWTERHYEFCGYVPALEPGRLPDRASLRATLGYERDETVCLVSVGGSAAGAALLRRVVEASPALHERIPGLRIVAVAGPRIDRESLPEDGGLDRRGYVHELYREAAACDVAIVQGGLATTMELVAAGRPFVSVPLARHFEQRVHVRHRLDRHGARSWLEFADLTPEALADAVDEALRVPVVYRPVPRDAAYRAARLIAELV